MTLFDTAKRIARAEAVKPQTAYRRLQEAAEAGEATFPLSDRDLALAAREAVRANQPATATIALDELVLRLTGDEPIESLERAA